MPITAENPLHHHYDMLGQTSPMNPEKAKEEPDAETRRDDWWGGITRKGITKVFEEDLEQKEGLVNLAGGGLLPLLGDPKSDIWAAMTDIFETDEEIEIAGISFTKAQLELLGDFSRYLRDEKEISFICIDDRLMPGAEGHDPKNCSIHEGCGAAGAIEKAISQSVRFISAGSTVADMALSELGQVNKQKLVKGMEGAHETSTILVTFDPQALVVKPERFDKFREEKALPMNVTIPLQLIESYIAHRDLLDEKTNHNSLREALLNVLFKWNVDIAKAVIGNKAHNNDGGTSNVLVVAHTPLSLGQQPLDVLHSKLIDNSHTHDRYFIISD